MGAMICRLDAAVQFLMMFEPNGVHQNLVSTLQRCECVTSINRRFGR